MEESICTEVDSSTGGGQVGDCDPIKSLEAFACVGRDSPQTYSLSGGAPPDLPRTATAQGQGLLGDGNDEVLT